MDKDDKRRLAIERLEKRRAELNAQIDKQRDRINTIIDKKKAKLGGELNPKQEQIITAALELLNENGLNNLSLRDIAKRINIQAPALYWHFKNKEALIDYMAEAILQKEFKDLQVRAENEDWQQWLIGLMIRLRKAMLAYKDGGRVVAGAHLYPAVTLATITETGMASLMSAGVNIKTARYILLTATHYTFGHVIEEQAAPTPEQVAEFDVQSFLGHYPHIAKALSEAYEEDPEANFVVGLRYIIVGGIATQTALGK